MDQITKDKGTKILILGVLFTIITFAAGRLTSMACTALGIDYIMASIIVRSILAVVFINVLKGGKILRFDLHSIIDTWKFVLPLIIINCLIGCLTVYGLVTAAMAGELELGNALYWTAYSTILCLLVGVNEEGMFRGLLLGGLLAKTGDTKGGILKAAIISSVIFGAVHVIFDVDYTNGYSIATGLMKTLETSLFAFVFCLPVIKNENIWGTITAHGFFDWIILCGNTVAAGGMEAPTYVSTDPDIAKSAIILFSVMAVLYLPRTIRAAKEMLQLDVPQYGAFME